MENFSFLKRNIRDLEIPIILILIGIAAISYVAVSAATAGQTGLGGYGKRELIFEALGFAVMFFMMFVDYRALARLRWIFYGVTILLLIVVFHFYNASYGAYSWIRITSSIQFQPSELAKIAVIIWIADYMARMNARENPDYSFKALLPIFGIVLVPFALILKEPALGQALVLVAITLCMLCVYVKKRHARIIVLALLMVVTLLVLAKGVFPAQAIHFLEHQRFMKGFQAKRIITFIDPSSDPAHSFNVLQARTAIGSGEMFGIGVGPSNSAVFVPEQWTDWIFSAVGERLGFIGASVLVFLFLLMFYRLMRVASTAPDDFGLFFTTGVLGMFAFQTFENIAMNISMMPATGIALPFVSYGGTALVTYMAVIGLVLGVSLRRRKLRFS